MKPVDQDLLNVLASHERMTAKVEKVRALIARGCNVNIKGEYNLTPLHAAVQHQHWTRERREPEAVALATMLLEAGAKPNPTGAAVTPFEHAIERNDDVSDAIVDTSIKLMNLLLAHGAKLPKRWRLADFSCVSLKMFEKLCSLGASLEPADGKTPIEAVIQTQRPALLEALLAMGAPTNTKNKLGQTPLGMAEAVTTASPKQRAVKAQIIDMLVRAGVSTGSSAFPLAELRAAAAKAKLARSLDRVLAENVASAEDLVARLRRGATDDAAAIIRVLSEVLKKPRAQKKARDFEVKELTFHHGDFVVKGNLDLQAPFVVTGDVSVSGVISDMGPDSWVVIGGNCKARALFTDGEFCVAGTLDATDLVHGHYNDNTLRAAQIRSRVVIADEHDIQAKVMASDVFFDATAYRQGRGKGVQARLQQLFVPEVFGEDGLDGDALQKHLRAKRSIWRRR